MAWLMLLLALQDPAVDGMNGRDRAGIAAKINGDIITWDEVELRLRSYLPEQRTDDLRQAELRKLAQERLFQHFARQYKIAITEQQIDEHIKADKKKLGSDERFEEYLRFLKKSLTEYREETRQGLTERALVNRLYAEAIRSPNLRSVMLLDGVSPDELRDYYRGNPEEFKADQNVTVLRIGLTFNDDEEKALKRRLAESLLRKLAEGTDFLLMAQLYSDTPRTLVKGKPIPGWIELKREEAAEFFSADTVTLLFKTLNPGDVSPIVEDGRTLNLFKVERRRDEKQKTFEEAQLDIRKQMESRKREENRVVLRNELLKQSHVEPADLFR